MSKPNISHLGVVVAVVLFLSFFYVYQKIQILRVGYKIREVEKKTAGFQKDNSFLRLKISSLESPERIAKEVEKLGLDLVPPKEKQILRMKGNV